MLTYANTRPGTCTYFRCGRPAQPKGRYEQRSEPRCYDHNPSRMYWEKRHQAAARQDEEERDYAAAARYYEDLRARLDRQPEEVRVVREAYEEFTGRGGNGRRFMDLLDQGCLDLRTSDGRAIYTDDAGEIRAAWDHELYEYRDDSDDDDDYRDRSHLYEDAEVRFYDSHSGAPVYGPEPDGEPVAGRQYESRWWVPNGETRTDWGPVDRVFDFAQAAA